MKRDRPFFSIVMLLCSHSIIVPSNTNWLSPRLCMNKLKEKIRASTLSARLSLSVVGKGELGQMRSQIGLESMATFSSFVNDRFLLMFRSKTCSRISIVYSISPRTNETNNCKKRNWFLLWLLLLLWRIYGERKETSMSSSRWKKRSQSSHSDLSSELHR